MPDLRNGSLEGEQYLEEVQVPPPSCTSLKNSSLLCPLCPALLLAGPMLCWGQCWVTASCFPAEGWIGFLDLVSAGYIRKNCPLLHFLVSFSASRFFFSHSHNDCNRILFSCSQLLAISNLIHSVPRTEFNTFLPL